MELFTPAWNSKYPEKRIKAVRKITDLEKLRRIAEKMKYEDARQEAWRRIALEAKDWKVRRAAVQKITDQTILKELLLKDLNSDVRKAALERITDQKTLEAIVVNTSNDTGICVAATNKITDLTLLADIAKTAECCEARVTALGVLLKFNQFDESDLMRRINTFGRLSTGPDYFEIMRLVFSKITTPSVLLKYQPFQRNEMLDKLFLWRVIDLAKDDPKVFNQFQAKANCIIKNSHSDVTHETKGAHVDVKQLVEGTSSSDCHHDAIPPWKPAMTGFGHGYHRDGYRPGEPRHQDSNPLSDRFQPYFPDKDK